SVENSGGVPMKVRAVAMLITILISTKLAMSQSTFGNMIGVVKDPGALVVGGAQVTLSGVDDRSTHNATTTEDGTFEFMNVKPGRYEVVVQALDSQTRRSLSLNLLRDRQCGWTSLSK